MKAETDALAACRYLIERVKAQSGLRWRQGARRPALECASAEAAARLVAERRLCGVPEVCARALIGWVEGRRPAVGLTHAPAPREVLALTARGRRPVSLLDGKDGLSFVLHDLCHLEKFADAAHHAGQVGLFALLDRAVGGPEWAALEAGLDELWRAHRDHVLADMNGASVYLFVVLRARLLEACARSGVHPDERLRRLEALLGVAPDAGSVELESRFAMVGERVLAGAYIATFSTARFTRMDSR
jgi:hypothetical protein